MLTEMFAAYRTALVQMTKQGGKVVPMPQGVKLEKPKSFTGFIDTDVLNIYFFQVE